jgi:hypothetical protein
VFEQLNIDVRKVRCPGQFVGTSGEQLAISYQAWLSSLPREFAVVSVSGNLQQSLGGNSNSLESICSSLHIFANRLI